MNDGHALRRHARGRLVDVEREILVSALAEHDVLLDPQVPGVRSLSLSLQRLTL